VDVIHRYPVINASSSFIIGPLSRKFVDPCDCFAGSARLLWRRPSLHRDILHLAGQDYRVASCDLKGSAGSLPDLVQFVL
jgi:hypothetical protein